MGWGDEGSNAGWSRLHKTSIRNKAMKDNSRISLLCGAGLAFSHHVILGMVYGNGLATLFVDHVSQRNHTSILLISVLIEAFFRGCFFSIVPWVSETSS